MKYTSITLAVLLAGAASLPATIVSVFNIQSGDLANDLVLLDNTGAVLPNGVGTVKVGIFTGAVDIGLTNFSQLGTTQPLGGGLGGEGLFGPIEIQQDTATAGAFIGQPISVVIEANGLVGVWSSTNTFLADAAGLESTAQAGVQAGKGDAALGAIVAGPHVANVPGPGDLPFQQGFQLVPEPSTSLLAGLAGLGLLIRRKR